MGHLSRKDISIGGLVELREMRIESRRKRLIGSRFPKVPSTGLLNELETRV